MTAADMPLPGAPRADVPLTVVGLGNLHRGDDGVGMVVAGMLEEQRLRGEWNGSAAVVAGGDDPTCVAAALAEGGRVLVVDAADMGQVPGTWRVLSGEEVLAARAPRGSSTHSLSLAAVARMARELGCASGLRVLGIQAGSTAPGTGLSPGVRACLPAVLREIEKEAGGSP